MYVSKPVFTFLRQFSPPMLAACVLPSQQEMLVNPLPVFVPAISIQTRYCALATATLNATIMAGKRSIFLHIRAPFADKPNWTIREDRLDSIQASELVSRLFTLPLPPLQG